MIISPSLLACDFTKLIDELRAFEGEESLWFHLDVMDGHFVPNLSFGYPVIKSIAQQTKTPLDAHFMVTNPDLHLDLLKNVPLHNFTFHFEAVQNHLELIKKIKTQYSSAGISIRPKTLTNDLSDQILKSVDLVLVMSVEPGFGGQKFMPNSIKKVRDLKDRRDELGVHFQIQVDGGINSENARELIKAGADNLVAGSTIFNSKDYIQTIRDLRCH